MNVWVVLLSHSLCLIHCKGWYTLLLVFQCAVHERMSYYAARASFHVYLCSLQSLHRADDIHTSSYQKQQTAGGSQYTVCLPHYVPSCMKLNLRVSRILRGYIMLLCCGRMLKSTCSIKCHTSNLEQVIFKNLGKNNKLQSVSYLFLKTECKKMSCLHTSPYTTTFFYVSSGKKYSITCTRKQIHACTKQTLLTV